MRGISKSHRIDSDNFVNDSSTPKTAKWVMNKEIQILRKYLRFPTISPVSNYGND